MLQACVAECPHCFVSAGVMTPTSGGECERGPNHDTGWKTLKTGLEQWVGHHCGTRPWPDQETTIHPTLPHLHSSRTTPALEEILFTEDLTKILLRPPPVAAGRRWFATNSYGGLSTRQQSSDPGQHSNESAR